MCRDTPSIYNKILISIIYDTAETSELLETVFYLTQHFHAASIRVYATLLACKLYYSGKDTMMVETEHVVGASTIPSLQENLLDVIYHQRLHKLKK